MLTGSPPIHPPPPKPTGAPGAPNQEVSSSHGLGSNTLNSALDVALLSSPTRFSANVPVDAVCGMCIGPAPQRFPHSSACKPVGSTAPPTETWMCSFGANPRALNCTGTPGGPAHGLNSTVGLSGVTCTSRRSSAALDWPRKTIEYVPAARLGSLT